MPHALLVADADGTQGVRRVCGETLLFEEVHDCVGGGSECAIGRARRGRGYARSKSDLRTARTGTGAFRDRGSGGAQASPPPQATRLGKVLVHHSEMLDEVVEGLAGPRWDDL